MTSAHSATGTTTEKHKPKQQQHDANAETHDTPKSNTQDSPDPKGQTGTPTTPSPRVTRARRVAVIPPGYGSGGFGVLVAEIRFHGFLTETVWGLHPKREM